MCVEKCQNEAIEQCQSRSETTDINFADCWNSIFKKACAVLKFGNKAKIFKFVVLNCVINMFNFENVQ